MAAGHAAPAITDQNLQWQLLYQVRVLCALTVFTMSSGSRGLTNSDRERSAVALRGQVIGLFRAGMKVCEIASELGLNRKTVSKWITR